MKKNTVWRKTKNAPPKRRRARKARMRRDEERYMLNRPIV